VLSQAAPGAIMVVCATLLVSLFTTVFNYSDEVRTTMCVILTAACSLTVLQRISMPFTKQRRIVFLMMTLLFILAIVFLPDLFMIVHLDLFSFACTMAGVFTIPIIINLVFFRLQRLEKIKNRITNATEK